MESKIIRNDEAEVINTEWGSLKWMAGKNTPEYGMTLGQVTFKPGLDNPAHLHPECDEILYVLSGTIEHTLPEGGQTILKQGDSICLPRGKFHKARNVGSEDAVVIVAFNSAQRSVIKQGEGESC